MNRVIFIAFLVCLKIYSQDLTGNWKAISYEDEKFFYDKTKDSIAYKDISLKEEVDDYKETYVPQILALTLSFGKNGEFTLHGPKGKKQFGTYSFSGQSGKVVFSEAGKKQKHNVPITLIKDVLYLKIPNEAGFFTVGFKK